jgi:hypothetical protein
VREADNLTISCAECHEIWEPKPPGTLWTTPGLLRDCFMYVEQINLEFRRSDSTVTNEIRILEFKRMVCHLHIEQNQN